MNKEFLVTLKEIGKEFSILYVEDDDNIRDAIELILKQFFHTVHTAKNGAEGLELFKTTAVDIVFTDIEMPLMNGLDMTQKIREISYDVPICIISAFNDIEKFTRAIKNRVNRYLLKPIVEESLMNTLYEMIMELKNKIDAKKYYAKLQEEKISKAVEKTAHYFLQSVPSPVFVVDCNRKIIYFNDLLNEMVLQKNSTMTIGESVEVIEALFHRENGKKVSIDEMTDDTKQNQKIIFKYNHESFYYMPRKLEVKIPTIEGKSNIVVLNDITTQVKQIYIIEYQKQKLQASKEILVEFLSNKIFPTPAKQKEGMEKIFEKSAFNTNEMLLRRTHIYKISAMDYISTLSDTIADDLEELNELELEIQSEIYEFEYTQKLLSLNTIANIIRQYANTIVRLIEFSDLADAVASVALYLDELTQEHIDANGYLIKAVIQSILDDLSSWKEHVFISQTTNDIHYLDSSLYNTILELKNSFENPASSDESDKEEGAEEDLEFF